MNAKVLQPAGWATPKGYANGVAVQGLQVYVAGQIGWNAASQFESDDLVAQVRQALANVRAVLAEAGAEPAHIVRMTWYLTDKREYLSRVREIGAAFREVIGHYAIAMTAVQVLALIEDKFKDFEGFKEAFREAAMKIQGSGWVYLSTGGDIKTIPNHQVRTDICVLVDWWEHVWALDYEWDKEKYLDNIWRIIDWDVCNERL